MGRNTPLRKANTANKVKKPAAGLLTIGTKMLKKRKIGLVERSDIKLQQETTVELRREPELDAKNLREGPRLQSRLSRRFAQHSIPSRPRSRIHKKKTKSAVKVVPDNGPTKAKKLKSVQATKKIKPVQRAKKSKPRGSAAAASGSGSAPHKRFSFQISMKSVLKNMIVPIKITIEECPELEERLLEEDQLTLSFPPKQHSVTEASTSTSLSSSSSSASDRTNSNRSDVSSPNIFKDAGAYIRNALMAVPASKLKAVVEDEEKVED